LYEYSSYMYDVYLDPTNSVFYQDRNLLEVIRNEFKADYLVLRKDTHQFNLFRNKFPILSERKPIYAKNGIFIFPVVENQSMVFD